MAMIRKYVIQLVSSIKNLESPEVDLICHGFSWRLVSTVLCLHMDLCHYLYVMVSVGDLFSTVLCLHMDLCHYGTRIIYGTQSIAG